MKIDVLDGRVRRRRAPCLEQQTPAADGSVLTRVLVWQGALVAQDPMPVLQVALGMEIRGASLP